jgi:hypothetical protein
MLSPSAAFSAAFQYCLSSDTLTFGMADDSAITMMASRLGNYQTRSSAVYHLKSTSAQLVGIEYNRFRRACGGFIEVVDLLAQALAWSRR